LDIEGWVGGTLTEYYSAERSASNSGVVGVSERIYRLKIAANALRARRALAA
jgi:hypothetical protein